VKLLRASVGFLFSFAVAWVVIFTFTQPQFKERVSAMIFTYKTPAAPIYSYVLGAFVIGLALGLASTAYTYLRTAARVRRCTREARELAEENERLRASVQSDVDGQGEEYGAPAAGDSDESPTGVS
jgi:hypothetical protein